MPSDWNFLVWLAVSAFGGGMPWFSKRFARCCRSALAEWRQLFREIRHPVTPKELASEFASEANLGKGRGL